MRHHASASELLVGFYTKETGRPGMACDEALDAALSFGWIDGVRRRVNDESFCIRFTPRKARSYWSAVNIRKANALIARGEMTPAGLAAFERRARSTDRRYSFENKPSALPAPFLKQLQANARAWADWNARPPGYRRTVTFWVVSAKQQATRERRLATLIACSARGERIPAMRVSADQTL
jgi:uncharacterized protein YdeI (YjbR/CyaY-like superfamily)